nr:MAG: hypothetical protein CM15mV30_1500 [uncultured marine virus]
MPTTAPNVVVIETSCKSVIVAEPVTFPASVIVDHLVRLLNRHHQLSLSVAVKVLPAP